MGSKSRLRGPICAAVSAGYMALWRGIPAERPETGRARLGVQQTRAYVFSQLYDP